MAKQFLDKTDLDDIKSMSSRIMADLEDAKSISRELTDVFNVQKNLTNATVLAQQGKIESAKMYLGIANIEKDIIKAINEGNLESVDLNQQMLILRSKLNNLSKEEKKALTSVKGIMQDNINLLLERNMLDETRADVIKRQNDKAKEQKDILKDLESKTLGIYENLKETVKNPATMLSFLAWQTFKGIKAAVDVSDQLGLSFSQTAKSTKEMALALKDTAMYGAGMKETAEAFGAIVSLSGDLEDATAKSVANVTKLMQLTGLAADQSAELNRTFLDIANGSQEIATGMSDSAIMMARAANVAPQKVFADLAANSEEIYLHGRHGVEQLIKASIAAKKLGVEYSSIVSTAEKILEIDSSIEQEMQASALIGRNINLNRARELVMAGDMLGYQKEIARQLGTQAEWDQLNLIQKRALANAIGLSVTETARVIEHRQKIMGLDKEIAGGLQNVTAELDQQMDYWKWLRNPDTLGTVLSVLGLMLSAMRTFKFGLKTTTLLFKTPIFLLKQMGLLLVGLANKALAFAKISPLAVHKGITSVTGKMSNWFKGVQDKILGTKKVAEKVTEDVKDTTQKKAWTGRRNPLVNWLNTWNRLKPAALAKFSLAVGVMILSLPALAWALKQFTDVPWEAALTGMGSLLGLAVIMRIIGNMSGNLLKGSIAIAILSAALIPAAYAFSLLTGLDVNSIIAFSLALPLLAAGVIALGAGIMAALPFFAVGIAALIALGGALIVLGFAFEKISGSVSGFGDIFSNLGDTFSEIKPLLADFVTMAPALLLMGISFGLLSAGLIGFAGALFIVGAGLPVLMTLSGILSLVDSSIRGITESLTNFISGLVQTQGTIFTAATSFGVLSAALLGIIATAGLAALSLTGLSLSILGLTISLPVLALFAGGLTLIGVALNLINPNIISLKDSVYSASDAISQMTGSLFGIISMVPMASGAMIGLSLSLLTLIPSVPILLLVAGGLTMISASLSLIDPDILIQLKSTILQLADGFGSLSISLIGIVSNALMAGASLVGLGLSVLTLIPTLPILMLFAGSISMISNALSGISVDGLNVLKSTISDLSNNVQELISSAVGLGAVSLGLLALSGSLLLLVPTAPILLITALAASSLTASLLSINDIAQPLSDTIQILTSSLLGMGSGLLALSVGLISLIGLTPALPALALGVIMLGGAFLIASPGVALFTGLIQTLKNTLPDVVEQLKQVTFTGFSGLSGIVTELFSFAGAMLILGGTVPVMMAIAFTSNILANAIERMASAGQILNQSFSGVRESLASIVPTFGQMISMIPGLYTLSSGIMALSTSLIPLSTSLAIVSPLISVLEKIGSITTATEKTEVAEKEETDNSEKYDAMIERLDKLIAITEAGSKIYINDRQMGRWVGLHTSKVNAIENRG